MLRTLLAFGLAALACTPLAAGEEGRAALRGTQGLAAVPFAARNDAAEPIDCVAALAHWYSLDLGRADPGHTLEGMLWFDASNGELLALNREQDRMPVQALTCGLVGAAWTTGTPIGFERRVGSVPEPVSLVCRLRGGTLTCS